MQHRKTRSLQTTLRPDQTETPNQLEIKIVFSLVLVKINIEHDIFQIREKICFEKDLTAKRANFQIDAKKTSK